MVHLGCHHCLIASIPHSGTRFTRNLLKAHGYGMRGRRTFALHHFEWGALPSADVVVVPVRHPQRLMESWSKRGKPLAGLVPQIEAMLRTDAYFLPVDSPHRDGYLAALSDALGVELSTDWRALHVSAQPLRGEVDASAVLDQFRGFYGRFYEV